MPQINNDKLVRKTLVELKMCKFFSYIQFIMKFKMTVNRKEMH